MYLTQSLHRNVQQRPHAVATICGTHTVTYAQSLDRVSRLAGALRSHGVTRGDRVAILSLNSDRYFETILATAWADAVTVPANTRWSVKEIAYSLNDAEVRHLLLDDVFSSLADELRSACPQLDVVVHCGDGPTPAGMLSYETLIAETGAIPDAHRGGGSLAGIFYTGGTTGFPKGVMLSHRNLLTSAAGCAATGAWSPEGRVLHAAPMFHLADLGSMIAHLLLGGTHVMIPAFDPIATLTAIVEHRISDSLLVPTMIQMVADHPRLAEFDTSSLRNVMYGASPISEALLGRARAAFPSASFAQGYGMTELAPVATILEDKHHDDPVRRRSAGRAAPHALVEIVDPDGNEVPRGTVGEIVVSGEHVMLAYWNKPAETADAIRDGWMHTGDGGYMDDEGFVFVADRIKDMIISGGENVYSIEVENVVAKHPAVTQCAVIAVPDDQWGERVHAVVSLAPGATLTLEELREHSKKEIAGYKVPRSLAIVDSFPLSAAGKILKRDLRKQYA
ncbi:acyl-CoA synthetase [Rhodococcus jostii]|uniref:Acyl-CoA synthetase (AMP-forming)/AMP-acid ligase II n=1 Tax=Rhodococcus jostii TaxID=132919 RepID=A0A1H5BLB9_RHOJO|nr:long-chain fatty acid--CoA ligase [Rhodococcus jostii]SED55419.1 Acyl-CoA synthetase (AMP-forming)/AMP-acid ligase II [Rhodococcus jostii]